MEGPSIKSFIIYFTIDSQVKSDQDVTQKINITKLKTSKTEFTNQILNELKKKKKINIELPGI